MPETWREPLAYDLPNEHHYPCATVHVQVRARPGAVFHPVEIEAIHLQ